MRSLLISLLGPRPKLGALALMVRWFWWFFVGHPVTVLAAVSVALASVPVHGFVLGVRDAALAGAVVEAVLFGVGWFVCPVRSWQQGYRFLRKWPSVYGTIAHRPTVVDVEAPTLNRARSRSVGMRPLLAAPFLFPVPRIRGGVVSFRCHPPPGKTFAELAANANSIAAAHRTVTQVMVDYDKTTATVGHLVVIFGDPLAKVIRADWATRPTIGIPDLAPDHAPIKTEIGAAA